MSKPDAHEEANSGFSWGGLVVVITLVGLLGLFVFNAMNAPTDEERILAECGEDPELPEYDTDWGSASTPSQQFAEHIYDETPDITSGYTPYEEAGVSTTYGGEMPLLVPYQSSRIISKRLGLGKGEVVCSEYEVQANPGSREWIRTHRAWHRWGRTAGFESSGRTEIPRHPFGYFKVDPQEEIVFFYPPEQPPLGVWVVHDDFFKAPFKVEFSEDTHTLTISNPTGYTGRVAVWTEDLSS